MTERKSALGEFYSAVATERDTPKALLVMRRKDLYNQLMGVAQSRPELAMLMGCAASHVLKGDNPT